MVKNPPAIQETQVQSLGQKDPLEKGMATHFNILAWRIPWREEPGGLQTMGSQRVRHNWATNTRRSISLHNPAPYTPPSLCPTFSLPPSLTPDAHCLVEHTLRSGPWPASFLWANRQQGPVFHLHAGGCAPSPSWPGCFCSFGFLTRRGWPPKKIPLSNPNHEKNIGSFGKSSVCDDTCCQTTFQGGWAAQEDVCEGHWWHQALCKHSLQQLVTSLSERRLHSNCNTQQEVQTEEEARKISGCWDYSKENKSFNTEETVVSSY